MIRLARLSLEEDIRAISGTPNWLLILFDKLAELCPDREPRLRNYYPGLEMLVHGGVDFKPYAKRFTELLEGSRAELREVYPASEAFIAIADRGPGEGLRLIVDNGVFFEFVPAKELSASNPTRHWLGNAEPGIEYAVVVSTCAGAWAYVLGDTVKFLELDPPRILVTGRTSYVLSAFGEHLIGSEIEEAIARRRGCDQCGCCRLLRCAQLSRERRPESCPSLCRGVRRLPSACKPTRSVRQRARCPSLRVER